ncbi:MULTISPECIES: DNRLRE domain-containing protein [Mumia]|uniref:DNRLRE domain-containing protein n=1 Tax=Mumia TaxID=1546255 RepID=UPI001423232E|nr:MULTISPECIES: DNRLRE domain-containing protein [unclassified Mumia]QMW66931.1 DNRLRE domain-containing protein [Mumia sp. ZJ1417]
MVASIVITVSTALVAGTLGPASSAAALTEPEEPSPSVVVTDSDRDGVQDRPDAVSAALAARLADEKVEDLSARTESTQLFANPDGTWTQEAASGPVRVVDEAGAWHDIDTTIVPIAGATGLTARYASADVVFSPGGDKTFATVTDEKGNRSSFGWPTALPKPVVDGDTVTYPRALENGDLVVQALPTGFSHSVVLQAAPTEPLEIPIPLQIPDGELTVNDSGSLVVKADGKKVVTAPQPLMWDAAVGNDDLPNNVEPVEAAVEASGSGASEKQTLVLSPDAHWLSDPATVYPVTVDPSYTMYANGDSWVQNAGYTTSQGGSTELRAGTYDAGGHKARSFVKFIGMLNDNGGSGQDIVSATFKMRNWYSGSCTSSAIRIARITETWAVGDLTWDNQPTVTSTGSSTFAPAYGYSASCDADGNQASWDATAIVQAWADGAANNGIRVAADNEASNATWRKYRSSEHTNTDTRPRMSVTYNSYPNKAAAPVVVGATTYGGVTYVNKKTFNVSSKVTDPDGGTLTGLFDVSGPAGSWSGLAGSAVSSNGSSVRSYTLNTDGVYTTKARARDSAGLISKNYSASTTFTVDTAVPTATISCPGYSNGVWYDTRPAASTTCTFGGSADVVSWSWRLNDGAWKTSTGSTGAIAIPESGATQIEYYSADRAGNKSQTITFGFGVGAASLVAPVGGERSTSTFAIEAHGPGFVDELTLEWRASGSSAAWAPVDALTERDGGDWDGTLQLAGAMKTTGQLIWDARQDAVPSPALIDVRVCFDSTTSGMKCGPARTVSLIPGAFGDSFPVAEVGPGTVSLYSGEVMVEDSDAAGIGRTYRSMSGPATNAASVLGPGWAADLSGSGGATSGLEVRDDLTGLGLLVLEPADGAMTLWGTGAGPIAAGSTGTFTFVKGFGDITGALTLEASMSEWRLRLREDDGTITVWTATPGGGAWQLTSVTGPAEVGATTFGHDPQGRVSDIFTPVSATLACSETSQDVGCRHTHLTYSDISGGLGSRLTSVAEIVHATTGPQSTVVAEYSYDDEGRLTGVADPRVTNADGEGAATTYAYSGSGDQSRLSSVTPAGEETWELGYDDDNDRLDQVQRTLPGSNDKARWEIVYQVPTSGEDLPDLTPQAITAWDQGGTDAPIAGAAVFGPNAPAERDWKYASLTYYDVEGHTTNTAVYGAGDWLVDSYGYDKHGNVTWAIDAAARARILAIDPAQRTTEAIDLSTITGYNADGTRVESILGPQRAVVTESGEVVQGRPVTSYTYDDETTQTQLIVGRPADEPETPRNLVVEETSSVLDLWGGAYYDEKVTRYRYDPVQNGDGNGWELGVATRTSVWLGGDKAQPSNWSTTLTRHDTEGKEIETRTPQGVASHDGAGTDPRSTITVYYTADDSARDSRCRNKPQWAGQECLTGPAGQPASGASVPTTLYAAYDPQLNPTLIKESRDPSPTTPSNEIERVTTNTFDDAGHITSEHTIVNNAPAGDRAVARTNYTYDTVTGALTAISNDESTISITYDSWGREKSRTDSSGNTSTKTYDRAGRLSTHNDGKGGYTYSYEGSGEHRGLVTGLDVDLPNGQADEFTVEYTPRGAPATMTYPNGITARWTYDAADNPTNLAYTVGEEVVSFSQTYDISDRVRTSVTPGSDRSFRYDRRDRLVRVDDTSGVGPVEQSMCERREYSLSLDSNRDALTKSGADSSGRCDGSAPTTIASAFDAADRITGGYSYDALGRTRTIPGEASNMPAGGEVDVRYFANDMVASLAQGEASTDPLAENGVAYELDPADRIAVIEQHVGATPVRTLNHFSDESDSPAWSTTIAGDSTGEEGSVTWSRNLTGPFGTLVGQQLDEGPAIFDLADLQGHLVLRAGTDMEGNVAIGPFSEFDEFGGLQAGAVQTYGWHGGAARPANLVGGLMLMGARLYNPTTGRFLSRDAISGGNDNSYIYPADPINLADLPGLATKWLFNKKIKPENAAKWAKRIRNAKRFTDLISEGLKYVSKVPNWGTVVKIVVDILMSIAADIATDIMRAHGATPPRGHYLHRIRIRIGIGNWGWKFWKFRPKFNIIPLYQRRHGRQ